MNLGTFNLAITRLSKSASSLPPDTKVLVDKDALAIADAMRDFLVLSHTSENFDLLGLKTDRFVGDHINKLTTKLNNLGVELDPASSPFDLLVEKKAIDAAAVVTSFGANKKCIEVPLVSEMITIVSDYEFYKKLRVKAPEKFTAPENAMTAYAKKHRLALRLTSNAHLSDEEKSKRGEKREVNFDLLKKFTFKAKKEA